MALHSRPIAYYPVHAKITGSIAGGVVLSQLAFWCVAMKGKKFYKTDQEIRDETGLSEHEWKNVKAKLKTLKFLKITREGIPATTFYEFDWLGFIEHIGWGKEETDPPSSEDGIQASSEDGCPTGSDDGLQSIKGTENTQRIPETTAQAPLELEQPPSPAKLPGNLKPETWDDFKASRKALKAKMTDRAEKLLLRQLTELAAKGEDAEKIVEQSIANGWRGIFPVKGQNERKPYDAHRETLPEAWRAKYDELKAEGLDAEDIEYQMGEAGFDHRRQIR